MLVQYAFRSARALKRHRRARQAKTMTTTQTRMTHHGESGIRFEICIDYVTNQPDRFDPIYPITTDLNTHGYGDQKKRDIRSRHFRVWLRFE